MGLEVKLRVWDKVLERLSLISGVQYDFDTECMTIYYLKGGFKRILKSECIITQWIGLTDMDGQGIYDGDYIEVVGVGILSVGWETKKAAFAAKKPMWLVPYYFGQEIDPAKCGVVGNRFETPDMLEVSDE